MMKFFLKSPKTPDDDLCMNMDTVTESLSRELSEQQEASMDDDADELFFDLDESTLSNINYKPMPNANTKNVMDENFQNNSISKKNQPADPLKPNQQNTHIPQQINLPSDNINSRTPVTKSFSQALTNRISPTTTPSCHCLPPSPCVALDIPHHVSPNYGTLANELKNCGVVKNIKFDISAKIYTAVFMCGCQAITARDHLKNKHSTILDPYVPTQEPETDYVPKQHLNTDSKEKRKPIPLPKYYYLNAEENASIFNIRPFLEEAIGKIKTDDLTRLGRGFLLKAATETQAFMIPHIDFNNTDIIKAEPHRSFNTSKGVIKSKELYNAKDLIIKRDANLEITNISRISNSVIVILTFPMSELPSSLKIHGTTFPVERYEEKPLRCRKCFSCLHITKFCKRGSLCVKCSRPAESHPEGETCTQPTCCALCKGQHESTDQNCPVYKNEKYILNESRKLGLSRGQFRAYQRQDQSTQPTSNHPVSPTSPENTPKTNNQPLTPKKNQGWKLINNKKKRKAKETKDDRKEPNNEPVFELPDIFAHKVSEVIVTQRTNTGTDEALPQQTPTPVNLNYTHSPTGKGNQDDDNPTSIALVNINPIEPLQQLHKELEKSTNIQNERISSKCVTPDSQVEERRKTISHSRTPDRTERKKTPIKKGSTFCTNCKIKFKTTTCLTEHNESFHPIKKKHPQKIQIDNRAAYKIQKEHSCGRTPSERCRYLYEVYREDDPKTRHLIDCRGAKYDCVRDFRLGPSYSRGYPKGLEYEKIYGPISRQPTQQEKNTKTDPEIENTKYIADEKDSDFKNTSTPRRTTEARGKDQLSPTLSSVTRKRVRSLSPLHTQSPLVNQLLPENRPQRPRRSSPYGSLVRSRVSMMEQTLHHPESNSHLPRLTNLHQSWPSRSYSSLNLWRPSPRDPRIQGLHDVQLTLMQHSSTVPTQREPQSTITQMQDLNIQTIITQRGDPTVD